MRARLRRARGFTLLEVTVTLALTATVFAFVLPWVTNLIAASTADLDDADDQRTVAAIDTLLATDLGALVTCPATRTPLLAADADTLVVLSAAAGDVQQVTWRVHDGTLSRSTVPAQVSRDGCGPLEGTDPEAAWDVIATGVHVHADGPDWAVHAWTGHAPDDARAVSVALTVGEAGHLARTFALPAAPASLS